MPHRCPLVFLPCVRRERARMITPKLSLDEFRQHPDTALAAFIARVESARSARTCRLSRCC